MAKAWVYILLCADGSYYTGHTTNLEMRMAEHQADEGGEWTKRRLPVGLVFSQEMPDKDAAFLAERQIKQWSRAKKEALIAGEWDLLKWLAKKPQFRGKIKGAF
jgi:predicted GIY-YIG superfamily endonuclease